MCQVLLETLEVELPFTKVMRLYFVVAIIINRYILYILLLSTSCIVFLIMCLYIPWMGFNVIFI